MEASLLERLVATACTAAAAARCDTSLVPSVFRNQVPSTVFVRGIECALLTAVAQRLQHFATPDAVSPLLCHSVCLKSVCGCDAQAELQCAATDSGRWMHCAAHASITRFHRELLRCHSAFAGIEAAVMGAAARSLPLVLLVSECDMLLYNAPMELDQIHAFSQLMDVWRCPGCYALPLKTADEVPAPSTALKPRVALLIASTSTTSHRDAPLFRLLNAIKFTVKLKNVVTVHRAGFSTTASQRSMCLWANPTSAESAVGAGELLTLDVDIRVVSDDELGEDLSSSAALTLSGDAANQTFWGYASTLRFLVERVISPIRAAVSPDATAATLSSTTHTDESFYDTSSHALGDPVAPSLPGAPSTLAPATLLSLSAAAPTRMPLSAVAATKLSLAAMRIMGVGPPSGVLIHGPSGCGKSHLAKELARMIGIPCIVVQSPQMLSKYYGDSEAQVRTVFARARASAPCLLCFDEIDTICGRRSGGFLDGSTSSSGASASNSVHDRLLATFLNEMDGIGQRQSEGGAGGGEGTLLAAHTAERGTKVVLVVGICSHPEALDPALLRPGRFDLHVALSKPTYEDCVLIFEAAFKEVPLAGDVNLRELAARFVGQPTSSLLQLRDVALGKAREAATAARTKQVEEVTRALAGLSVAATEGVPATMCSTATQIPPSRAASSCVLNQATLLSLALELNLVR